MIKTYTGNFDDIRLGFSLGPPPLKNERGFDRRYAHLHIYLDGQDAASEVPSGFMTYILTQLLFKFDAIIAGEHVTISWYSDPWDLLLQGDLHQNKLFMTLHVPKKWMAIDNATVPLDVFCKELLELSRQWLQFLQHEYADIIADPKEEKYYHRLKQLLQNAERR